MQAGICEAGLHPFEHCHHNCLAEESLKSRKEFINAPIADESMHRFARPRQHDDAMLINWNSCTDSAVLGVSNVPFVVPNKTNSV